jgi:integrase
MGVILSCIIRKPIRERGGLTRILMASIWKHPQSKYWVACYTDQEGRQRKKSTKIDAKEKNRGKAQKVAEALDDAHRRRSTTTQIFKMCSELVKEVTGEDMASATVSDFMDGYLKLRAEEVTIKTLAAYSTAAKKFKDWLGERATLDLFRIEKTHIREFRDHLGSVLHPTTANHNLKLLRIFFKEAKRGGLIFDNPCDDVPTLRNENDGTQRRGFTIAELKVVMKEVKGTEWASLVRFGLYSAQRLGDLATLRWSQLDLENEEIRIPPIKGRRQKQLVLLPICAPLKDHILSLEAGDKPDAYVHPKAAALGVSHLSREFGEILGRCGMRAENRVHAKLEGRTGERRELNALSFHSLRHSAVSMMKNAGISPAVVQDLVGHKSAEMSAHYTHIESAAKRKALKSLPKI